jgi:tetratricopeptide (TPR) repeat protein
MKKAIQLCDELRPTLISADMYDAQLSQWYTSLCEYQTKQGQWSEALNSAQEALKLQRQLCKQLPEIFLPDVSDSIAQISLCHASLKQWADALQAIGESILLCQELYEGNQEVYRQKYANTLYNCSFFNAALKRPSDAAEMLARAMNIQEGLFNADPDAHRQHMTYIFRMICQSLDDLRKGPGGEEQG